MNVILDPIKGEGKRAFTQLLYLYNFYYDFSDFTNDDIPEDGYFYGDADYFMDKPNARCYFIRVDGKIAGYAVIIDGEGRYSGENGVHKLDEFFVTRKYRRRGVGKAAAKAAFDMFPGAWEVCSLRENENARAFWKTVISEYTNGAYRECDDGKDDLMGFIFHK